MNSSEIKNYYDMDHEVRGLHGLVILLKDIIVSNYEEFRY